MKTRSVLAVAVALAVLPGATEAAPVPTITTVAGSPGSGPGTSVALNVAAFAIRGTTLYAADPWWSVVRRLDTRTGQVTVVAGNGSRATYGDGGPALAAGVGRPSAVAVAADGTLYVGQSDGLVRRVGSDGRIATVAGGGTQADPLLPLPARQVRLGMVNGLSLTADGDLLIADGNRVRRMTADGVLTTVAGTGEPGYSGDGGPARLARLNYLGEVIEAPDGSVYVADELNHRVRRISHLGIITTVAGNGTRGDRPQNLSTGDGGPAVAARITYPDALAFDASGALLVGAAGSVRRVDAAGRISTWVRWVDGEALAVGPDGSTYVASTRVHRREPSGRTRVVAGAGLESGDGGRATAAQIYEPRSVAVVPAGLLVGDAATGHVRLVDGGGRIRTYLDTGSERVGVPHDWDTFPGLAGADDVAVDRDGTVYVLDEFFGTLFRWRGPGTMRHVAGTYARFDACEGASGDGGPATKAALCQPLGLAVRDGRVLVADTGADRVRLVDARGRITTVARLKQPVAVAWAPGGAFVVADVEGVHQVDARGRVRTLATVTRPADVAVTGRGTVYVLDGLGRVLRLTGGAPVVVAGSGLPGWAGDGGDARKARIGAATGLALSRDERTLYVADPSSHRVRAVRL